MKRKRIPCEACQSWHYSHDKKGKPIGYRERTRRCLLGFKNGGTGTLYYVCQDARRMRDKEICQRCGKHCPGENEGHHVLRQSRGAALKYILNNLLTLCVGPGGCHSWWHNNEAEATVWFRDTWPDRWDDITEKQRQSRQTTGTIEIEFYLGQLQGLRDFMVSLQSPRETPVRG